MARNQSNANDRDAQTEAILDEIDAQTPDESIHRAYAESQLGRVQVLDVNDIADEEGLDREEQPAEVAEAVIDAQSDYFGTLAETNELRDQLEQFGIELDEDAPETEYAWWQ
ncbi:MULTISPECIES: hypothetical protein [Halococcus]|uniref:Uncharacterized protein n=1 Tax=Halococcus saccharolyticus DSM 5350 TaxID=1227455 RepID=M0MGN3_9EURY|nr:MULTISPECIES: hypothetical protein [Halococcus]EMA43565.1 hypothetical protein C449_13437 [Halococcus saccharolyticus DSM 5350]